MSEAFINLYTNTLASPCSSGTTSLTVSDPTPLPSGSGFTFRLLIDSEIMICTARTGAVLTVERGQEGTTAVAHSGGATVENILTAGAQGQLETDVYNEATGAVEDGSVVAYWVSFTATTADLSGGGTVPYVGNVEPYVTQITLQNNTTPGTIFQLVTDVAGGVTWLCNLALDGNTEDVILQNSTPTTVGFLPLGAVALTFIDTFEDTTHFIIPGWEFDSSSFQPTTYAPVTFYRENVIIDTTDFTDDGSLWTIDTIPLPGTTGNPAPNTGPTLMTLDVDIKIQSTESNQCAWWRYSWAFTFNGGPLPLGSAAVSTLAIGNSTDTPAAIPTGWSINIALDGPEENVLVEFQSSTTGELLDVGYSRQWSNLQ